MAKPVAEALATTLSIADDSATIPDRLPYSPQFENNCFAAIWRGSEEGSHSRLIDCCITQL